ncbi:hypothetical protein SAMN05428965_1553 [Geodermatophilus sp. DSM 45219]|nr:hypothetical protein SAMN05428965_1553 [Geodermatophilus sp. DSM 45219]
MDSPVRGAHMEPDPREPTGDLGYDMAHEDMAHEVTGSRPRPQAETPEAPPPDDAAGDLGYDEAHDFRR